MPLGSYADTSIYNAPINEVCFDRWFPCKHSTMARATPPSKQTNGDPSGENPAPHTAWDVELLRVLVSRTGTQVDAQWAIHPQLKLDLMSNEWEEVSELMIKVTTIVGNRFSEILSNVDPAPPGHA